MIELTTKYGNTGKEMPRFPFIYVLWIETRSMKSDDVRLMLNMLKHLKIPLDKLEMHSVIGQNFEVFC